MDTIIMISMIGMFLVFGVFLLNGKGAFLIAGYNTMPKEEKAKYDVAALTKFMGKMMFALSFSMVFWVVSDFYDHDWLFYIGLAMFISIVAFMIVYVNTGNRFKR